MNSEDWDTQYPANEGFDSRTADLDDRSVSNFCILKCI